MLVTLIGACSLIYLAGFSLNNLSIMAVIVAIGLVVDDAIVVLALSVTLNRESRLCKLPLRAFRKSA